MLKVVGILISVSLAVATATTIQTSLPLAEPYASRTVIEEKEAAEKAIEAFDMRQKDEMRAARIAVNEEKDTINEALKALEKIKDPLVDDRRLMAIRNNLPVSYPDDPILSSVVYTYDGALWIIQAVERGDYKAARRAINIYNSYFREGDAALPASVNVKSGAVNEGNQHAGANAWMLIALTRYLNYKENITAEDLPVLDFAIDLAKYLMSLRNTDDTEAYGAVATNKGSPYYSTEHNISARAALKMLSELIAGKVVKRSGNIDSVLAQLLNQLEVAVNDIEEYLLRSMMVRVHDQTGVNIEFIVPLLRIGYDNRVFGFTVYQAKSYYLRRGYSEEDGWDDTFATDLALWLALSMDESEFAAFRGRMKQALKEQIDNAQPNPQSHDRVNELMDHLASMNRKDLVRQTEHYARVNVEVELSDGRKKSVRLLDFTDEKGRIACGRGGQPATAIETIVGRGKGTVEENKEMGWLEGTSFGALALRRVGETGDAKAYLLAVEGLKEEGALPYATLQGEKTGHGWETPHGKKSLASTVWYDLARNNVNPMKLEKQNEFKTDVDMEAFRYAFDPQMHLEHISEYVEATLEGLQEHMDELEAVEDPRGKLLLFNLALSYMYLSSDVGRGDRQSFFTPELGGLFGDLAVIGITHEAVRKGDVYGPLAWYVALDRLMQLANLRIGKKAQEKGAVVYLPSEKDKGFDLKILPFYGKDGWDTKPVVNEWFKLELFNTFGLGQEVVLFAMGGEEKLTPKYDLVGLFQKLFKREYEAVVIPSEAMRFAYVEAVYDPAPDSAYFLSRVGENKYILRYNYKSDQLSVLAKQRIFVPGTEQFLNDYNAYMPDGMLVPVAGLASLNQSATYLEGIFLHYGVKIDVNTGAVEVIESTDDLGYVIGVQDEGAPAIHFEVLSGKLIVPGVKGALLDAALRKGGSIRQTIHGKTLEIKQVPVARIMGTSTYYVFDDSALDKLPVVVLEKDYTIGFGRYGNTLKKGTTVTFQEPFAFEVELGGKKRMIPAVIEYNETEHENDPYRFKTENGEIKQTGPPFITWEEKRGWDENTAYWTNWVIDYKARLAKAVMVPRYAQFPVIDVKKREFIKEETTVSTKGNWDAFDYEVSFGWPANTEDALQSTGAWAETFFLSLGTLLNWTHRWAPKLDFDGQGHLVGASADREVSELFAARHLSKQSITSVPFFSEEGFLKVTKGAWPQTESAISDHRSLTSAQRSALINGFGLLHFVSGNTRPLSEHEAHRAVWLGNVIPEVNQRLKPYRIHYTKNENDLRIVINGRQIDIDDAAAEALVVLGRDEVGFVQPGVLFLQQRIAALNGVATIYDPVRGAKPFTEAEFVEILKTGNVAARPVKNVKSVKPLYAYTVVNYKGYSGRLSMGLKGVAIMQDLERTEYAQPYTKGSGNFRMATKKQIAQGLVSGEVVSIRHEGKWVLAVPHAEGMAQPRLVYKGKPYALIGIPRIAMRESIDAAEGLGFIPGTPDAQTGDLATEITPEILCCLRDGAWSYKGKHYGLTSTQETVDGENVRVMRVRGLKDKEGNDIVLELTDKGHALFEEITLNRVMVETPTGNRYYTLAQFKERMIEAAAEAEFEGVQAWDPLGREKVRVILQPDGRCVYEEVIYSNDNRWPIKEVLAYELDTEISGLIPYAKTNSRGMLRLPDTSEVLLLEVREWDGRKTGSLLNLFGVAPEDGNGWKVGDERVQFRFYELINGDIDLSKEFLLQVADNDSTSQSYIGTVKDGLFVPQQLVSRSSEVPFASISHHTALKNLIETITANKRFAAMADLKDLKWFKSATINEKGDAFGERYQAFVKKKSAVARAHKESVIEVDVYGNCDIKTSLEDGSSIHTRYALYNSDGIPLAVSFATESKKTTINLDKELLFVDHRDERTGLWNKREYLNGDGFFDYSYESMLDNLDEIGAFPVERTEHSEYQHSNVSPVLLKAWGVAASTQTFYRLYNGARDILAGGSKFVAVHEGWEYTENGITYYGLIESQKEVIFYKDDHGEDETFRLQCCVFRDFAGNVRMQYFAVDDKYVMGVYAYDFDRNGISRESIVLVNHENRWIALESTAYQDSMRVNLAGQESGQRRSLAFLFEVTRFGNCIDMAVGTETIPAGYAKVHDQREKLLSETKDIASRYMIAKTGDGRLAIRMDGYSLNRHAQRVGDPKYITFMPEQTDILSAKEVGPLHFGHALNSYAYGYTGTMDVSSYVKDEWNNSGHIASRKIDAIYTDQVSKRPVIQCYMEDTRPGRQTLRAGIYDLLGGWPTAEVYGRVISTYKRDPKTIKTVYYKPYPLYPILNYVEVSEPIIKEGAYIFAPKVQEGIYTKIGGSIVERGIASEFVQEHSKKFLRGFAVAQVEKQNPATGFIESGLVAFDLQKGNPARVPLSYGSRSEHGFTDTTKGAVWDIKYVLPWLFVILGLIPFVGLVSGRIVRSREKERRTQKDTPLWTRELSDIVNERIILNTLGLLTINDRNEIVLADRMAAQGGESGVVPNYFYGSDGPIEGRFSGQLRVLANLVGEWVHVNEGISPDDMLGDHPWLNGLDAYITIWSYIARFWIKEGGHESMHVWSRLEDYVGEFVDRFRQLLIKYKKALSRGESVDELNEKLLALFNERGLCVRHAPLAFNDKERESNDRTRLRRIVSFFIQGIIDTSDIKLESFQADTGICVREERERETITGASGAYSIVRDIGEGALFKDVEFPNEGFLGKLVRVMSRYMLTVDGACSHEQGIAQIRHMLRDYEAFKKREGSNNMQDHPFVLIGARNIVSFCPAIIMALIAVNAFAGGQSLFSHFAGAIVPTSGFFLSTPYGACLAAIVLGVGLCSFGKWMLRRRYVNDYSFRVRSQGIYKPFMWHAAGNTLRSFGFTSLSVLLFYKALSVDVVTAKLLFWVLSGFCLLEVAGLVLPMVLSFLGVIFDLKCNIFSPARGGSILGTALKMIWRPAVVSGKTPLDMVMAAVFYYVTIIAFAVTASVLFLNVHQLYFIGKLVSGSTTSVSIALVFVALALYLTQFGIGQAIVIAATFVRKFPVVVLGVVAAFITGWTFVLIPGIDTPLYIGLAALPFAAIAFYHETISLFFKRPVSKDTAFPQALFNGQRTIGHIFFGSQALASEVFSSNVESVLKQYLDAYDVMKNNLDSKAVTLLGSQSLNRSDLENMFRLLLEKERRAKITLFHPLQIQHPGKQNEFSDEVKRKLVSADLVIQVADQEEAQTLRRAWDIRRWMYSHCINGGSQDSAVNLVEMVLAYKKEGFDKSILLYLGHNKFNDTSELPSKTDTSAVTEVGQRIKLCKMLEAISDVRATVCYSWTPFSCKAAGMLEMDLVPGTEHLKKLIIVDRNACCNDLDAFISDFKRSVSDQNMVIMIPGRGTTKTLTRMGQASQLIEEGHRMYLQGSEFLGGRAGECIGTGWGNIISLYGGEMLDKYADPQAVLRPLTSAFSKHGAYATNFGLQLFNAHALGVSEDIWAVQQQTYQAVALGRTPSYGFSHALWHKKRETYSVWAWVPAMPRWSGGALQKMFDRTMQSIFELGPLSIFAKSVRIQGSRYFITVPFAFIFIFLVPFAIILDVSPFKDAVVLLLVLGMIFNQILAGHSLILYVDQTGYNKWFALLAGTALFAVYCMFPTMNVAWIFIAFVVGGVAEGLLRWMVTRPRDLILFPTLLIIQMLGQFIRQTCEFAISGRNDTNFYQVSAVADFEKDFQKITEKIRELRKNLKQRRDYLKKEKVRKLTMKEYLEEDIKYWFTIHFIRELFSYVFNTMISPISMVGVLMFVSSLWALTHVVSLTDVCLLYLTLTFSIGVMIGPFVMTVQRGRSLGCFNKVFAVLGGIAGVALSISIPKIEFVSPYVALAAVFALITGFIMITSVNPFSRDKNGAHLRDGLITNGLRSILMRNRFAQWSFSAFFMPQDLMGNYKQVRDKKYTVVERGVLRKEALFAQVEQENQGYRQQVHRAILMLKRGFAIGFFASIPFCYVPVLKMFHIEVDEAIVGIPTSHLLMSTVIIVTVLACLWFGIGLKRKREIRVIVRRRREALIAFERSFSCISNFDQSRIYALFADIKTFIDQESLRYAAEYMDKVEKILRKSELVRSI